LPSHLPENTALRTSIIFLEKCSSALSFWWPLMKLFIEKYRDATFCALVLPFKLLMTEYCRSPPLFIGTVYYEM
jgi:hypothetical protein